jgi:hypothetical protein
MGREGALSAAALVADKSLIAAFNAWKASALSFLLFFTIVSKD